MSNSRLLENKTALITGSNRGIGKAILEKFAQSGANIWACARCRTTNFEDLLNKLSIKYNVSVIPLYFDLSDEDQTKEAISSLLKKKEKIDILVNNAGKLFGSFFQMTSMKELKNLFQVNFFSPMLIIQLIAKLMQRNKNGIVINISSVSGIDAEVGFTAYGASKASLVFATKVLAKELAIHGIRVNCIAPGMTNTDMAQGLEHKAREQALNLTALKRMANPDEIAKVALFLASEESSYITGQIIRVDGGM